MTNPDSSKSTDHIADETLDAQRVFDKCEVCGEFIAESTVGLCGVCALKGPPRWSECSGEQDFYYKNLRYRDQTKLKSLEHRQLAIAAIGREVARSRLTLKKTLAAQRLLPTSASNLTFSNLEIVLSALPDESRKRVSSYLNGLDISL